MPPLCHLAPGAFHINASEKPILSPKHGGFSLRTEIRFEFDVNAMLISVRTWNGAFR
jgi:hypothetical protein